MGLRKNESKVSNKGIPNELSDMEKLHILCCFHEYDLEECKNCAIKNRIFIDHMNHFTIDFHPSKCSNKFQTLNGKLTEVLSKKDTLKIKKIKVK